jgi:hypothetical protein
MTAELVTPLLFRRSMRGRVGVAGVASDPLVPAAATPLLRKEP